MEAPDYLGCHTVHAPAQLWRIGHEEHPLQPSCPPPHVRECADLGNRFDSELGDYGVLYFGSNEEASFGEVLAPLRPDTEMLQVVTPEWQDRKYGLTWEVSSQWRSGKIKVAVEVVDDRPFIDVEDLATREVLGRRLAPLLHTHGIQHVNVDVIRGKDRRITRAVSQLIHDLQDQGGRPLCAGIRFLSKINTGWECWALFEHTQYRTINGEHVCAADPSLESVVKQFGFRST